MTFVEWRLEHYKDLQATGTPDNVIKRFSTPNIIVTSGDGRDSFEFTVKTNASVSSNIEPQDKVLIKREVNSSQFDSDSVIMNGAVNKVPKTDDASKETITVKGNNYSKTLMDATVFRDVRDLPVDEALQEALNSIENYAPDFSVDWNSNNPSTKTNGDPFPEVGERWYDKPMRNILEDYTKDSNTEDGDYYYYVDTNNTLVWRPETDNVSDVIDNTFPYKSLELKRDTEDVVNFVKVKGGTLPTGGAIEAQYIDFGSAGKNGLRFKAIQGNENYVDSLHNQTMNSLGADDEDIRPSEISGFSYPISASTVAWQTSNDINSDQEYFQSLKAAVQSRLQDDGKDVVDNQKFGYIEIELEISPKHNIFQLGELFDNQLEDFTSNELRVQEVQYGEVIDVVTLREDEPSVGE